jgi:hypothetical protein
MGRILDSFQLPYVPEACTIVGEQNTKVISNGEGLCDSPSEEGAGSFAGF